MLTKVRLLSPSSINPAYHVRVSSAVETQVRSEFTIVRSSKHYCTAWWKQNTAKSNFLRIGHLDDYNGDIKQVKQVSVSKDISIRGGTKYWHGNISSLDLQEGEEHNGNKTFNFWVVIIPCDASFAFMHRTLFVLHLISFFICAYHVCVVLNLVCLLLKKVIFVGLSMTESNKTSRTESAKMSQPVTATDYTDGLQGSSAENNGSHLHKKNNNNKQNTSSNASEQQGETLMSSKQPQCSPLTCWGWCCLHGEVFSWRSVQVWVWVDRGAPPAAGSGRHGGSDSALWENALSGSAAAGSGSQTQRGSPLSPFHTQTSTRWNSHAILSHRHYHKSQAAATYNCVLQSADEPNSDVKYDLWHLPFACSNKCD